METRSNWATDRPSGAEVFPPGEYLQEELEARSMKAQDLADATGIDVRRVRNVLTGGMELDTGFALALSELWGTSAEVWLRLQAEFNINRDLKAYRKLAARMS